MKRPTQAATIWLIAFTLVVALTIGCGNARRDEPITRTLDLSTPQLVLGQRVFFNTCNQCHPGGAAGYGPSLNDRDLPQWYIKLQVRHSLGAMPAFGTDRIPDDQLDAVATYLQALHDLNGR